ncbi:putative L-type lectin-domain containing receptor kinase V.2 isoform X2 [Jatropha curcas]|uniref:putative L-type lectin-domain containing receptor kinase V.2 isoform X2 n=1 Tax=Jatropha curcas TaxID=180498 RepID=UPI0009D695C6|nr:putative L-type lectin-domain containing receptor kinase V.2 isoform X2 [Jatropha curcas]
MSCIIIFILCFFLNLSSSYSKIQDSGFLFDGYFKLGSEGTELNNSNLFSRLIYTDGGLSKASQVFYNTPIQFKNSNSTNSLFSFSTTFIFAVVHKDQEFSGHGLAFAISPSKGFYSNNDHSRFRKMDLKSGKAIQVWVEYGSLNQELNVTIHPVGIPKPQVPLLSLTRDISSLLFDFMYVGFTSSTGSKSAHYILGWSFKTNGQADEIDLSNIPKIPGVNENEGSDNGGDGYAKKQEVLAIILSLVGAVLVIVLIFGGLIIFRRRRFIQVVEDWEVLYGPYRFAYKDLFIATKGFRDRQLLGRGGFGSVYRGSLPFSNVQIAVKKISHDSKQGMREFVAEIATIGRLRHPNLVRLLGYCRRKNELFLVYDYMPNGSLDKFLYRLPNNTILDWKQRFKIIKDVASALFYLHQQWLQIIIHRDVKPANVLIDNDMNAKLGDFGLAKLCDHGNDPQPSHVVGTPGYIAPELVQSGKSNTCTDTYAFGIFMLEVTCGRKPVDPRTSPEKVMLIDWVMDSWDREAILETVDPRLGEEYVRDEVELVLKLGLLCAHPMAEARPSMSSVVELLDGVAQLPENVNSVIKFQYSDRGIARHESISTGEISIPSLTFTEPFDSDGR